MRKRWVYINSLGLIYLISLFLGNAFAQKSTDSLYQLIQQYSKEPNIQIDWIHQQVKESRKKSPRLAIKWLNEGINIAIEAKKDSSHAFFHYLKGRLESRLGKQEKAYLTFLTAKEKYQKINHVIGQSKVINELGWLEIKKGNYIKARKQFEDALLYAEFAKKPLLEATNLNDIGVSYHYQKNYKKASSFYLKATKIREAENNISSLVISYNNLGLIFKLNNEFEKALKYYKKALQLAESRGDWRRIISLNTNIGNLKSKNKEYEVALKHYQKALKEAINFQSKSRIANCQYNLGRLFIKMNQLTTAQSHIKESMELYEELKEEKNRIAVLFEWGKVNYLLGNTKKGFTAMETSISKEEIYQNMTLSNYKYLAEAYKKEKKNTLAYAYLLKYTYLKDSIESVEMKTNIMELQIQFEEEYKSKEQEKEIALLQQKQGFQKNRFRLTFFFLIIILIISGILCWNLIQKLKINKLLNKQFNLVTKQRESLLLINAQKEEAVKKAQKAAKAKEDFLASMSHEIRTPMNAVIGITNLLIDESPRVDQIENLKTLKFSSNNLLGIINDILDFSKIESGNISLEKIDFSLEQLLKNITETFSVNSKNKGIALRLEGDFHQLNRQLIGDPTRLVQIFSNLLGNAIKFTSEGFVVLRANIQEITAINTIINFEVQDSGIGIDEDKLDRIFESFTQAANSTTRLFGGTGLGLSITKKLIELKGGKIKVKSKKGHGSTFYFTLNFPLGKAININADNTLSSNLSSKTGIEGASILLAEDNKINQLVAKKILSKWKIKLDIANDGVEVLEKLEKKDYDLILMDIQMPRMNGFEATEKIRALDSPKKDIPIIALTASAYHIISKGIGNYKMNDYVCKPFNPDNLFEKIKKCLNESALKKLNLPIIPTEPNKKLNFPNNMEAIKN